MMAGWNDVRRSWIALEGRYVEAQRVAVFVGTFYVGGLVTGVALAMGLWMWLP